MTLQHRYDFVLLFDVKDGNPNGDPDAGNLPRVDAQTQQGLVTDVCLKRKIRNYVALTREEQPGYDIYVKERAILNQQHQRAYTQLALNPEKPSADTVDRARDWMCQNFFDIRTFGAVMSTGVNCGQVRGPVQLTFARSIDPLVSADHTITRMAVTTEKESEKQEGSNRTMGRKFTIPYGLYRAHGFVSAPLAKKTGFSDADLTLLWEALTNLFDHDRSASRGEMTTRGLVVFEHESPYGNAPAHDLFDRLTVELKSGVDVPRRFEDYTVNLDLADLPAGVTVQTKVGSRALTSV